MKKYLLVLLQNTLCFVFLLLTKDVCPVVWGQWITEGFKAFSFFFLEIGMISVKAKQLVNSLLVYATKQKQSRFKSSDMFFRFKKKNTDERSFNVQH